MKIMSLFRAKPKRGRPILNGNALPDSIKEEYENGDAILNIAARYNSNFPMVRRKLVSLGVTIKPKGSYLNSRHKTHSYSKLTPEQVSWILEQDKNNVAHQEIAKRVGVTRERVRQICLEANHSTRRSRQTKTLLVKDAIATRQQEWNEYIQQASELWKAGATLPELGQMMGSPTIHATQARINNYRKQWPDKFPYRMKPHGGVPTSQEEIQRFSDLWKSDKSKEEIAKEMGYKSTASMTNGACAFRIRFPDLFPKRKTGTSKGRQIDMAMVKQLSELWNKGATVYEIAREMNFPNLNYVYGRITKYRRKWPDMFNRRKSPPVPKTR